MVTINYEYSDDPSHPNYERWMRSKEISIKKGEFIKSILVESITLKNKKILDLGSGFGGTLINFNENDNRLFSVDHSISKIKDQKKILKNCFFICASAKSLPFKLNYFDVIILQDSLEHFDKQFETLTGIVKSLAPNGIIYLSTPNRYSLFNILSDPHWGLPLVGFFSKPIIKKLFIPIFRRKEIGRPGIAELLSLNQLDSMFLKLKLSAELHTEEAVDALFKQPEQIIWSSLHVHLLKIIVNLKLSRLLRLLANDRFGLINKYLTPTFYFTIRKFH